MESVSMLALLLLAMAASVDILVVSISIGMTSRRNGPLSVLGTSLLFAMASVGMLWIGWSCVSSVDSFPSTVCRSIAAYLLIAIGLRAFRSGFIHDQESGKRPTDSQAEPKRQLLVVAIATSVDSLFLGAVLNLRQTGLIDASIIFGAVAWLAAWSGHCVGKQLKDSSQLSGEITSGILLIVLGLASLKA